MWIGRSIGSAIGSFQSQPPNPIFVRRRLCLVSNGIYMELSTLSCCPRTLPSQRQLCLATCPCPWIPFSETLGFSQQEKNCLSARQRSWEFQRVKLGSAAQPTWFPWPLVTILSVLSDKNFVNVDKMKNDLDKFLRPSSQAFTDMALKCLPHSGKRL